MNKDGRVFFVAAFAVAIFTVLGIISFAANREGKLSLQNMSVLDRQLLRSGYFLRETVSMSGERDLSWIGDYVPPDPLFITGLEYRTYRRHTQPLVGKRNVDIVAVVTNGDKVCWLKRNNEVLLSTTCD